MRVPVVEGGGAAGVTPLGSDLPAQVVGGRAGVDEAFEGFVRGSE